MNIGQIMETHLGWGAKELGRQLAALVDPGAALECNFRQEVKSVFNSPKSASLLTAWMMRSLVRIGQS